MNTEPLKARRGTMWTQRAWAGTKCTWEHTCTDDWQPWHLSVTPQWLSVRVADESPHTHTHTHTQAHTHESTRKQMHRHTHTQSGQASDNWKSLTVTLYTNQLLLSTNLNNTPLLPNCLPVRLSQSNLQYIVSSLSFRSLYNSNTLVCSLDTSSRLHLRLWKVSSAWRTFRKGLNVENVL
jgi:hypothetical protein